jgi:hypothetical protein
LVRLIHVSSGELVEEGPGKMAEMYEQVLDFSGFAWHNRDKRYRNFFLSNVFIPIPDIK